MSHLKSDPFLWKPRTNAFGATRSPDLGRCRASVSAQTGRFYSAKQCSRKGSHAYTMKDGAEVLFCKQHHPDAVARREAESESRWEEKMGAERSARKHAEESKRLAQRLLKECIAARKAGRLPVSVAAAVDAIVAHEGKRP